MQIDPSLNNTGVYRQRSYDNLQSNGKFNNNTSFKIKKSASTMLPSSGLDTAASTSSKALSPPAIAATIQTATTNTQTMLSPVNNNMIQTSPIPGTLPLNYSYYTPQTSYNSASTNANLSSGSGTDTDGGGASTSSSQNHHRRHSNNYPLNTLPRYLYQKNRGMPFVGQCTNNESYRSASRGSSSSSAKIYAHKNSAYSDRDFDEFENSLYQNNNNNNEIVATHFQRGSECEPMLRNSKKYHYNSNNQRSSLHSNSNNSSSSSNKKGYRRDSGTIVQKYPNSPYVSRKRHHRHSNVYDYRTTLNYDLNSINEDGVNET